MSQALNVRRWPFYFSCFNRNLNQSVFLSHHPIPLVLSLPPSNLPNGFKASSCWLKHWLFEVHVRSHCFLYLSLSVRHCLNIQTHCGPNPIFFVKPDLLLQAQAHPGEAVGVHSWIKSKCTFVWFMLQLCSWRFQS